MVIFSWSFFLIPLIPFLLSLSRTALTSPLYPCIYTCRRCPAHKSHCTLHEIVLHTFKFLLHTLRSKTHYFRLCAFKNLNKTCIDRLLHGLRVRIAMIGHICFNYWLTCGLRAGYSSVRTAGGASDRHWLKARRIIGLIYLLTYLWI